MKKLLFIIPVLFCLLPVANYADQELYKKLNTIRNSSTPPTKEELQKTHQTFEQAILLLKRTYRIRLFGGTEKDKQAILKEIKTLDPEMRDINYITTALIHTKLCVKAGYLSKGIPDTSQCSIALDNLRRHLWDLHYSEHNF